MPRCLEVESLRVRAPLAPYGFTIASRRSKLEARGGLGNTCYNFASCSGISQSTGLKPPHPERCGVASQSIISLIQYLGEIP